jgi:hypothetical protein
MSPELSAGRIDRIGSIFWGIHDAEEIVVRVLADYALVGKTPIDVLKQRAKKRVKEHAGKSGDGAKPAPKPEAAD